MGQQWTEAALGGGLTSETLSRNFRMAAQPLMKFRQFTRPEFALGAHNGESYTFKKSGDLEDLGQYVGEFDPVPKTQARITSGTVMVREATNSVEFTWRLNLLAKLSVEDWVIINLINNLARTMDYLASIPFRASSLVYTPTGATTAPTNALVTTGTPLSASSRPFVAFDAKNVVDLMRSTYRIPPFQGGDYVCVASTNFLRGLKDDNELVEVFKYGDPARLFSGEVGRYYKTRYIEENHVLTNTLPGNCGEAIFIGWDAVVEAMAYAEEIQTAVVDLWGRQHALRWLAYLGFERIWNFSVDGHERTMRVYSA